MVTSQMELPDPLEKGDHRSIGNADELLAQLAGDEIDRLLAEADVDRNPAARTLEAESRLDLMALEETVVPAQPPAAVETVEPIVNSATQPVAFKSAPAERGNASPADVEAHLSSQLDDLFAQLNRPSAAQAPKPSPAPASVAAVPQASPADVSARAPQVANPGTDATAREAILKAMDQAPSAPTLSANALAAVGNVAGESRPLPLLLRPLAWISAPMARCSDTTRTLIGTVAIMTLLNAAAVLIYVWFFRKP